jgi:hypothetical protein
MKETQMKLAGFKAQISRGRVAAQIQSRISHLTRFLENG